MLLVPSSSCMFPPFPKHRQTSPNKYEGLWWSLRSIQPWWTWYILVRVLKDRDKLTTEVRTIVPQPSCKVCKRQIQKLDPHEPGTRDIMRRIQRLNSDNSVVLSTRSLLSFSPSCVVSASPLLNSVAPRHKDAVPSRHRCALPNVPNILA